VGKNSNKNLNWADFQKLGNPENAPDLPEEKKKTKFDSFIVRVHLEKKHRGGKTASIIKGLKVHQTELKRIAKEIKQLCGVGGTCKDGEIIIQGEQRDKIIKYLTELGCKDVKKAGG